MSSLFRRTDRRANFKLFLLAGFVGSELMWIIRTDNKRADLDRQTAAQIKITRSIIERIKSGENVDVEKELLGGARAVSAATGDDGQSVNSILQNLEAMDSQWSHAGGAILKAPPTDNRAPAPSSDSSKGKGSAGFI